MNDLSWLIYLADVAGGVGYVSAFFGGFGVIAFGMLGTFYIIERSSPEPQEYDYSAKSTESAYRRNDRKADARDAFLALARKVLPPLGIGAAAMLTITTLSPSSSTVYAIAASEMGEEVVKSETAGKAMKALDAWLDKQIAPAEPSQ